MASLLMAAGESPKFTVRFREVFKTRGEVWFFVAEKWEEQEDVENYIFRKLIFLNIQTGKCRETSRFGVPYTDPEFQYLMISEGLSDTEADKYMSNIKEISVPFLNQMHFGIFFDMVIDVIINSGSEHSSPKYTKELKNIFEKTRHDNPVHHLQQFCWSSTLLRIDAIGDEAVAIRDQVNFAVEIAHFAKEKFDDSLIWAQQIQTKVRELLRSTNEKVRPITQDADRAENKENGSSVRQIHYEVSDEVIIGLVHKIWEDAYNLTPDFIKNNPYSLITRHAGAETREYVVGCMVKPFVTPQDLIQSARSFSKRMDSSKQPFVTLAENANHQYKSIATFTDGNFYVSPLKLKLQKKTIGPGFVIFDETRASSPPDTASPPARAPAAASSAPAPVAASPASPPATAAAASPASPPASPLVPLQLDFQVVREQAIELAIDMELVAETYDQSKRPRIEPRIEIPRSDVDFCRLRF